MRKRTFVTIFVGMILLMGMGYLNRAVAEVKINVGVNVPPPPPLVIPAPPPVIVIPNTYVYFPPEVEADLFFYHGYWYRPYQGRWYRSETIRDPGFISFQRGCPVPCYICHPITVMYHPYTNASHMDNLKRTGGHGRERSTGINTSTNMKEEKDPTSKKAGMDKGEAKGNTATRS